MTSPITKTRGKNKQTVKMQLPEVLIDFETWNEDDEPPYNPKLFDSWFKSKLKQKGVRLKTVADRKQGVLNE